MTLLKPKTFASRTIRSALKNRGGLCLFLFLFLLMHSNARAQSIMATSGGSVKNANGSVDFTLGQIDFIYVKNDSLAVSFGIQQPVIPDTLPRVDSLKCGSYTLVSMGLPVENETYQNTLRLPYVKGNGNRFDTIRFASQGVTGLTLQLNPGKLANGDSVLVFSISGKPSREGIAGFSIDFGGKTCELTINVGPQGPKLDSLLCAKATILPGQVYAKIPYKGILNLPYTGGNGKKAPSATFLSEGITGLKATFTSDTLKLGGGTLKLQLEGLADQIGTARFPVAIGGKTCIVELTVEDFAISAPNFFSPNGDGANDLWEIPNFQILYPNGAVIILDRNGRKLVEFNGNFNGWDGTINGKNALPGVYWYIVQTEKGTDSLKGNLTLIR